MKKSFIFTFIMAIVGAIVGAGFASGKEVVSFFGAYGYAGIAFVLLASILFFFCFFIFSKIGKITKAKSITDMTKAVFGKAGIFVDFGFVLCTFITLSAMLAGSDSIGQIMFADGYNFCYISILTCMIVAIVVSVGLKYIYKLTNAILPIMLVFMSVVLISFMTTSPANAVSSQNISFNGFSAVLSSVLYVSMNVFTNIFIIAKSSQYMSKKQIGLACGISAGILLLMIELILFAIFHGGDAIFTSDMPMLAMAIYLGEPFGTLYAIVLWLAIFTTICIAGYTLVEWLYNFIKNKFVCSVTILSLGFIFSRFGFSTIVDVFYRLEGIFGCLIIICFAAYYFKNRKIFRAQQLLNLNQNILQSQGKIASNAKVFDANIANVSTVNAKHLSNADEQNFGADDIVSLKIEKKRGNVYITKRTRDGKTERQKRNNASQNDG